MILSETIKELRQLSGLSPDKFCEYLNISLVTLEQWEDDNCSQNPSVVMLMRAVAVMLQERKKMRHVTQVATRLTQARAIIISVSKSEDVSHAQRESLDTAAGILEKTHYHILP